MLRIALVVFVVLCGIGFEFCRRSSEGMPAMIKEIYYWETTGPYAKSTAADIAKGHSLVGKVVLVTGANSGIGKEAAQVFASIGADVTLACRSQAKCDEAKSEIEAKTPKGGNVSTAILDLNSLESVKSFAKEFLSHEKRLDLLINNAGIMDLPTYETTADGFEKQFGVNHLGHFHLTNLLLDTLKATAKKYGSARIINLSSQAHLFASGPLGLQEIDFSKLPLSPDQYDGGLSYGISKVSNILFSRELRNRLKGTGVLTAAGHPGIIKTGLDRYSSGSAAFYDMVLPFLEKIFGKQILKSIPQGASTTMCMALHDLPREHTSIDRLFFSDCVDAKDYPGRMATRIAFDEAKAAQLWKRSEQLVQDASK
jgi:NAD(P)-dependent dehydrogenase (short-subunit alcohol dehydrogenase family)